MPGIGQVPVSVGNSLARGNQIHSSHSFIVGIVKTVLRWLQAIPVPALQLPLSGPAGDIGIVAITDAPNGCCQSVRYCPMDESSRTVSG